MTVNKHPGLFQTFTTSKVLGPSDIIPRIDKAIESLKDSPTAVASAVAPLTKLAGSAGLTSIIAAIRQINPHLTKDEMSLVITHLLVTAKSETNFNWFALNKSNHFGLLQHSPANWANSLKLALSRMSKVDGLREIKTIAKQFGIPPGEVEFLDSKFGATDSKFYQVPAAAGAVTNNWIHFCKQFAWNGKEWTPRLELISQSPRWKELSKRADHTLTNQTQGAIALLSLIHVNGPSWYRTDRLRHLDRIISDGKTGAVMATTPIIMTFLKGLNSVGLNRGVAEKGDSDSHDHSPSQSTKGGWLAVRGDGTKHFGVDYEAPEGTPLIAPVDGEVSSVWTDTYGNNARFKTPDGFMYTFAHLKTLPSKGPVLKGEQFATVGATGTRINPNTKAKSSYHAHMHLSVRAPGDHVDERPDAFAKRKEDQKPYYNPNYAPIKPVSFLIKHDAT